MNTSSVVLIVLIGAVMLVVAIRTIMYNKARDRAYQAYRKAVGKLRSEFKENLDLAERTRDEMASGTVSKDRFRTQAWALLLTEPFLAQMDEEDLIDFRQLYNLIEEVEIYRSLIESSNQQAGFRTSEQNEEDRLTLLCMLDELTARLQRHLTRVSEG